MQLKHLNQKELARRWNISHRTLERWRWAGEGPQFMKLGGRVVYRMEDITAFKEDQLRHSTGAEPNPALAEWRGYCAGQATASLSQLRPV